MAKYKLPIILISMIIAVMLIGSYIPWEIKSFFYAISLSIKDLLILVLPFIIFSFLFNSLTSLKEKAIWFICLLLGTVALSNFIALTIGYTVGSNIMPNLNLNLKVSSSATILQPLWKLHIPKLISNEPAIIVGIITGIFFALKPNDNVIRFAKMMNYISINFLRNIFLPILPIFILGFILKLEYENILPKLFTTYGIVLILIVSTQFCYICFLYFILGNLKINKMLNYLKNIFPATITGFSTISSAVTMPVTIICTEKNLENPTFARMLIPTTANIHTIGSAIGLTILALATLHANSISMPTHIAFFTFAIYYTMAKFGVAGIPGGVLVVVTPLLETYLNFTPEMIGVVTAIYLLFDPFGTATNVTGNGAFAIFFSKIYKSDGLLQNTEGTEKIL